MADAAPFALFGPGGSTLPRWVRSWAEPRPVPISARGAAEVSALPPSAELMAWMRLFETHALESADPAEAELRAPGDLPSLGALLAGATGPSAVADLVGLLTASVVIAQQDELAYLASVAGTAAGLSRVFSFHPEDWGLHRSDPSISARIHRFAAAAVRGDRPFGRGGLALDEALGDALAEEARALPAFEARAGRDPLPPHLDPERLAARSDWLVRAWLGLPLERALTRAPSSAEWVRERDLFPSAPHLALYWLFDRALRGERAELDAVAAATRTSARPHVAEARAALLRWRAGREHELGPLDLAAWTAIREAVAAAERGPEGSRPGGPRGPLEDDEESADFLELLDHLRRAGPLAPWRGHEPGALEGVLAGLARDEHRALLDAELAETSALPEHHPRVGRGRILARAALAADVEELDRALEAAGGTERFGPTRRDELWRAVARFRSPEAHARLARGASAFAREAEDWIRTSSKVPWDALLARDAVETHDLVARFTEGVPLSAITEPLVVEAARAARAHGIARAVPGLRRAAAGAVGRLDDGGRAEIVWAVAELDPEAPAFLAALFPIVRSEWEEAEEEEDADRLAWALAICAGPLLAVAPAHREARAAAAALIARIAPRLGPERRPGPEVLEALRALVEGARLGPVDVLDKPVRALARLRPALRPASRAASSRLREAFARYSEDA